VQSVHDTAIMVVAWCSHIGAQACAPTLTNASNEGSRRATLGPREQR